MKKIGVLDCNNFFVSCERLFRPDLINRPVVVLSGNDGCVVARSQEIKDKGIPMGVPYFQIKDILKDSKTAVFSSNFTLYRDISRRVFEEIRNEFGEIEQYSIDECFFSANSLTKADLFLLKDKVEKRVGIPVSIGVSNTKTQAKYVNSVAKKSDGVQLWNTDEWNKSHQSIKLSEIWGVGNSKVKKFLKHNLITVADLCSTPKWLVGNLFGIDGVRLQAELSGQAVLSVKSARAVQKSVTSSRSFRNETKELAVLKEAVKYHVYQGVKELQAMDLQAGTIRLSISPSRYGDFFLQAKSMESSFDLPSADLFFLTKEALKLLKYSYSSNVPYKKVGLVFSGLVSRQGRTESLFGSKPRETLGLLPKSDDFNGNEDLTKLLLRINQGSKKDKIRLGGSLVKKGVAWDTKKNWLSPAYTTNWNELRTVTS